MKKILSVFTVAIVLFSTFCGSFTSNAADGSWHSDTDGWWYEYDGGGYPVSTWAEIDGYWYYFKADGYMSYSEYRDGCWLNEDGTWNTAYSGGYWASDSTGWWYTDESGWYPVSQWLWIDGKCYYFKSNGYMASNECIDGCWVRKDGAWDPKMSEPIDDTPKYSNWKEAARGRVEQLISLNQSNAYKYIYWDLFYINDDDIPELVVEYPWDFLNEVDHNNHINIDIYTYNEIKREYELTIDRHGFAPKSDRRYACYLERKGIVTFDNPLEIKSNDYYIDNENFIRTSCDFYKLVKNSADIEDFTYMKFDYDDGHVEYKTEKWLDGKYVVRDITKEQYEELMKADFKFLRASMTTSEILKKLK